MRTAPVAIPITIPRLGWNMEHGVFVGWLKANGDVVRVGESLFSLESDKATEDVECLDAGILRTTFAESFGTIDAANLKRAHALIESGRAKGKIVLEGFGR